MAHAETQISDQIRTYLEGKGFIIYRMQSGRFRGAGGWITMNPQGTPDLVGCTPDGRFICVEIKTVTGKASEEQKSILDDFRKRGAISLLAHSKAELIQQLTFESI